MKKEIDVLQIAKDLIKQQVNSLIDLQDRLNYDFINVVKLVANCDGRLIIIGLGKSGIIGRKISATLNSTGTISSFIHASDALHGDSGNISNQDIVLFISKSGNTDELKKLIPFVKKLEVQIIAMTGSLDSYLAKNSDFVLDVSVVKEACPNNLAPTTSTTMQLVMGDALSMSLLSLKEFTKEDFAQFHPGGTLGMRLSLTVDDLCDVSIKPEVSSSALLNDIIMEISSKRLGATAVVDDFKIQGVITDGDLRRLLESKENIAQVRADAFMTKNPKTISKHTLVYEAFSLMKKYNITQLLVTDNQKYIGIIHLHDILRHNFF